MTSGHFLKMVRGVLWPQDEGLICKARVGCTVVVSILDVVA